MHLLIDGIVSITPLDVYPRQNTSRFELRLGQTAVSPNQPTPLTSNGLTPYGRPCDFE